MRHEMETLYRSDRISVSRCHCGSYQVRLGAITLKMCASMFEETGRALVWAANWEVQSKAN